MLKKITFDDYADVHLHVTPSKDSPSDVFHINVFVLETGVKQFHTMMNADFKEEGYFLRLEFEYSMSKDEIKDGEIAETMVDKINTSTTIAAMQLLVAGEVHYQLYDAYEGSFKDRVTIFSQAVIELQGECPDLYTVAI